jgi:hypothetical protein
LSSTAQQLSEANKKIKILELKERDSPKATLTYKTLTRHRYSLNKFPLAISKYTRKPISPFPKRKAGNPQINMFTGNFIQKKKMSISAFHFVPL